MSTVYLSLLPSLREVLRQKQIPSSVPKTLAGNVTSSIQKHNQRSAISLRRNSAKIFVCSDTNLTTLWLASYGLMLVLALTSSSRLLVFSKLANGFARKLASTMTLI